MKALSVIQDWASAILLGKDIENRSWATNYTGPLVIHASKGHDPGAAAFIAERGITLPPNPPRGAILGAVTVKGCHNSAACVRTNRLAHLHPDGPYRCSPWAMGGATGHGPMYHWELVDPRPLREPIACRGALGLWTLPEDAAEAVTAQVAEVEASGGAA